MLPQYVSIGTNSSTTSTSLNVPWGGSHQADDIGLLVVQTRNETISTPSGWTFVATQSIGSTGGTTSVRLYVFWKRATGSSEADAALTLPANGRPVTANISVYRYARMDPGSPIGSNGSDTFTHTYSVGQPSTSMSFGPFGFTNLREELGVIFWGKTGPGNVTAPTFDSVSISQVFAFPPGSANGDPGASLDYAGYTLTSLNAGGTVNMVGIAVTLMPAFPESEFTITAGATVSNPGSSIGASPFVIAGSATVSNPGNVNRESAFTITSGATVSNPGAQKVASAFTITAGATVENPGGALVKSAFVITAGASVVFSGASDGSSSFVITSSSSMNMVGVALSESPFEIEGTSFVDFKSPQVVESSFSISGSSSVRMYSPNLQVSTLVDGSGGDPDGGAAIDWTLCDFADIELTEGTGSFPIDHINLIAGKKIAVHVHNNSGATGIILWDGGDAPVNWIGLDSPPAMPADGEILHVEFECNKDRTEIIGRLFVDDEIREILNGLDRRYSRTLFEHSTNAGNVGTAETALYSDIIPGGTLSQNNDKVLAEYAVEFAATANDKQLLLYFPTTVLIFDTDVLAITAAETCCLRVAIIRQTASTARAVVTISPLSVAITDGIVQITDETDLSGINFDADLDIRLAGLGEATDDIIAKLGYGEFKPAAV